MRSVLFCGVCVALLAATASAQEIEVIFTKIAGHPTALVPGALDQNGNPIITEFRAMEDLVGSQDGSRWVLKGRTQNTPDLETIMLLGSGKNGTMFAQEGQPIPGGEPNEVFDFFGSGVGRFDDAGRFAYSARAKGGAASIFQKVIFWDGVNSTVVFHMGDPISGLVDLPPNPSGDETFGNSVGSIHLLNNGSIGSQDSTIQNIHTSRRPAIMYDGQAFHQTGVTTITGMDSLPKTWATILANTFYTTPDGTRWTAQGRIVADAAVDTVVVIDGAIVLQEGSEIDGSGMFFTDAFRTNLLSNGDWYTRGSSPQGHWAVRNGTLMARTGAPIFTGSEENWGATIAGFTGNKYGDYVVLGTTNNPDPAIDHVIVYNGAQVVVREGDPVDLDGNGVFDDDVFIGRGNNTLSAFDADDLFLTDNGVLYFIANLRNSAGQDLNSNPVFGTPQALLRKIVGTVCTADLDDDNDVDQGDLGILLANFGCTGLPGDCPGDVDGDGDVDQSDLGALLSQFGCPHE
ncbi:MAG: hypothetical protein LC135_14230 [Phycisphaerae bacterium]|nr:hypothetical protein [Phycisphaerae bacterium]MCZ2401007.1 hypothetical protein [Phycisphaerae bacterium]NUQ49912.1 hypothetical protein [Phycisphaerae bacterium]